MKSKDSKLMNYESENPIHVHQKPDNIFLQGSLNFSFIVMKSSFIALQNLMGRKDIKMDGHTNRQIKTVYLSFGVGK